MPTIERVKVSDEREVIVVTVHQGRYRPYRYKGKPYKRVGAVTAEMTREEYERLFLEQLHASDRWEKSQPWNPLIAGARYRRGVVESLGSGIQRMIRMCLTARLLPPTISATATSVRVTFHRRNALPDALRDRGVSQDGMPLLLELLATGTPLSLRDLIEAVVGDPSRSERAVRASLQRLRQLDLVAPGGKGRGARWELTAAANDLLVGRPTMGRTGRG